MLPATIVPRRVDCSKLFVVSGESEFLGFLGGSLGFLGVSLRPAIFFSMVVLTTLGAVERRFDVVVPAIGLGGPGSHWPRHGRSMKTS